MTLIRGPVHPVHARSPDPVATAARRYVERLPSGSWRARAYAGTDPLTGKELRYRSTCKAEQAARIEHGRLLEQAAAALRPESDATVEQLLERYMTIADLDVSTRESYEGYIRRTILPALGRLQLRKVRGPVLDSFYARLRRCGDPACTGKAFTEHSAFPEQLVVDRRDERPAWRQVADAIRERGRSHRRGDHHQPTQTSKPSCLLTGAATDPEPRSPNGAQRRREIRRPMGYLHQEGIKNPSESQHVRHPYPMREIARQAGLSEATVDRVLNARGGVRPTTAREVRQAILDLDRQQTQLRLGGRTFMIDLVMQTPSRFSSAVRAALEAELPALRPAVVRARFDFRETGPSEDIVAALDRVAQRGSHGVILKAPDVPVVIAAVERLAQAKIPVVTFVTDLPSSPRVAYVGIDNRAAGATAAYLIGQWLGSGPGNVLVTVSNSFFRGEEEREMGFRSAMRADHPNRSLIAISEGGGLDAPMRDLVLDALERDPGISAVYSCGGGNVAAVEAFEELGRAYSAFIAHDLDRDNTRLLRTGCLSAVLHHDLHQDMRRACHIIMKAHGALPGGIHSSPSSIQVVTPYNMPPAGMRGTFGRPNASDDAMET